MKASIYRIIDVNLNRSREGLRVCEDISRFILNSPHLTSQFKRIRHRITTISKGLPVSSDELLERRDSDKDVGRRPHLNVKKKDWKEIFLTNIQRTEEAVRVLEEFSRVVNKRCAEDFQKLRFRVYTLEKKVIARF